MTVNGLDRCFLYRRKKLQEGNVRKRQFFDIGQRHPLLTAIGLPKAYLAGIFLNTNTGALPQKDSIGDLSSRTCHAAAARGTPSNATGFDFHQENV
jgi:hypothetical protein